MLQQILEALMKKEPLTAQQLADACECTTGDILRCLHDTPDGWWVVEEWAGKYKLRDLENGYVPYVWLGSGCPIVG